MVLGVSSVAPWTLLGPPGASLGVLGGASGAPGALLRVPNLATAESAICCSEIWDLWEVLGTTSGGPGWSLGGSRWLHGRSLSLLGLHWGQHQHQGHVQTLLELGLHATDTK